MEQENLTMPPIEGAARPGLVARILMVFSNPGQLFTHLTGKLDWLTPLIIIAILGGIFGHLTQPIYVRDMIPTVLKRVEQYRQYMTEQQYNETIAQIEEGQRDAGKFKWFHPLIALLLPFVIMVIIAALGLMCGNFFFGGRSGFWTIMNVVAFAALIGILGDVVRSILILVKDSSYVYTGLGLLKPTDDGSLLFYLFRQIDIFSVWRIIVTVIGLGVVYKMKPGRFAAVLIPVWLVFIVVVALLNKYMMAGGLIY